MYVFSFMLAQCPSQPELRRKCNSYWTDSHEKSKATLDELTTNILPPAKHFTNLSNVILQI